MKNIDKLRKMSAVELAQRLVYDDEGNERSPCGICISQDDCSDSCYLDVLEWLESEENE